MQLSLPNSELVVKVCELHQADFINKGTQLVLELVNLFA